MAVNKPVIDRMYVRVTPEQFSRAYELAKRLELGQYARMPCVHALQDLLSECAEQNGGVYDRNRHAAGVHCELIVIV